MSRIILETERLLLREFEHEDYPFFYELNSDPEVIKYTGDKAFESIEAAKKFVEQYDQYEKYGMGRWIVVLKSSGELTGWNGLKYMPDLGEVDLGYRFLRKFWGSGIATESSLACVEYGFEKLGLKRMIGRVMKGNTGSVRVLEKCGMHYVKDIQFDEHPGMLYELDNPKWKPRNYIPIDCNFYDELEAMATLGKTHHIIFTNEIGVHVAKEEGIKNLFTKEKEEFMELKDGTVFRLDDLVSIDGRNLPR